MCQWGRGILTQKGMIKMDLPIEIKRYIENELNMTNKTDLQNNAKAISLNYRTNEGKGKRLLKSEDEAIAYAISRMPATYGAVYNSLKSSLEIYNPSIKTVADIGAGTGTATIAVNELLNVDKIECFEREDSMQRIGKNIFEHYNNLLEKTNWIKLDICSDEITDKYDLVVTSYMLNEISDDQKEIIIEKLWKISNKMLLIVEPGTFLGYKNIINAKQKLIEMGAKIIAPCKNNECKLPKDDWCNFSCRVQRTKVHKELKEGNVPYEDEKYMYLAVSKEEFNGTDKKRILRHPMIYSGFVKLKVCGQEGISEITISKKDKDKFRIARKSKAGDLI